MATSYSPVQYEYREIIQEVISRGRTGKVFFFDDNDKVDSCEGIIVKLEDMPQLVMFITMIPEKKIRLDRVITVVVKPGAAFDEYASFANQCLSCTGGYD